MVFAGDDQEFAEFRRLTSPSAAGRSRDYNVRIEPETPRPVVQRQTSAPSPADPESAARLAAKQAELSEKRQKEAAALADRRKQWRAEQEERHKAASKLSQVVVKTRKTPRDQLCCQPGGKPTRHVFPTIPDTEASRKRYKRAHRANPQNVKNAQYSRCSCACFAQSRETEKAGSTPASRTISSARPAFPRQF